jgi:hypothetical protein
MKKLAGRRIVPMSHSVSEALEASAGGTDGIRPFRSQALTLRLIVHGAPRRLCQSGTGRRFMTLNLVERSFQPPPAVGDDARRAQREPHAARTKRSAESTWTKLKRCPAR